MEQPEIAQSSHDDLIHKLHERPQIPLTEWLRVPAHVHYKAFRMADPPTQRPASREEFRRLVESFQMAPNHTMLRETFGYAVKVAANGDRLIVVWQAHTEYYSYQLWHLPGTPGSQLTFGPLTFPDYRFPITPLGTEVCRLDIVLQADAIPSRDDLRQMLPGPVAYGSRIFDDETTVVTSFTPDEYRRERYLVSVGSTRIDVSHIKNIVDAVVRIETYYHLLLMQKPLFSAAIDSVYTFEQVHLKQREIITGHISHADSLALQRWLNSLTQDLLKTNRLAGKLHFELSAAVPYDKIVHATLASMVERPYAPHRPLSDYILSGVTGVADGYQQLLKRIETLSSGFEGMIAIIRTRVDLMLESQNLALLMSVDKTTKSQAILQHTVEGLSVIVIAYYLCGLVGYIFKGLHEMGWMHNPNVASAVFVPVAVVLAFLITTLSRKYLHKKLQTEKPHA